MKLQRQSIGFAVLAISAVTVYAVAGADVRVLGSKLEVSMASMPNGFALCGKACGNTPYYVGFARQNTAKLGTQQDAAPAKVLRTFPGVSDAKTILETRGKTAVRVEQENGNFVISEHRLETLRVGNLRKTETLMAQVTDQNGGAEAHVQLVWGDTLTVRSDRLARGTPVTLMLQRDMGGYGNPASQGAYYNVKSQTLMNGAAITDLDFVIKKFPGDGQKDQISGKDKLGYAIQAKVGQVIRLEGSLSVTDGVKSAPKSQQILNGGDSVMYTVSVSDSSACVKSSSGQLNAGTCSR
jgi:hypothetical protein